MNKILTKVYDGCIPNNTLINIQKNTGNHLVMDGKQIEIWKEMKVTETFYELKNGIDIPVDTTRFPKEYWVHATVYEKVEDE